MLDADVTVTKFTHYTTMLTPRDDFFETAFRFFFNFLECFPIDLPKIRTESEIVSVDLSLLYSELSIICPHFPFLKPFNLNK